MRHFRSGREKLELAGIDVSPLIDVVFILLIFFIITTTFTRQTGIDINKPKARSSKEMNKESLMIAVTGEGTIHLYNKQVNRRILKNILKKEVLLRPGTEVIVMADKKATAQMIIEVLDECTMAGIKKVSLASVKK